MDGLRRGRASFETRCALLRMTGQAGQPPCHNRPGILCMALRVYEGSHHPPRGPAMLLRILSAILFAIAANALLHAPALRRLSQTTSSRSWCRSRRAAAPMSWRVRWRRRCRRISASTIIIENKPGAGTIIGTQSVASSPPDGYTLLMAHLRQCGQSEPLQQAALRSAQGLRAGGAGGALRSMSSWSIRPRRSSRSRT